MQRLCWGLEQFLFGMFLCQRVEVWEDSDFFIPEPRVGKIVIERNFCNVEANIEVLYPFDFPSRSEFCMEIFKITT